MVQSAGQDGLLGLALHPLFLSTKPYVYIAYTYRSIDATHRLTKIERYAYTVVHNKATLNNPVTVIDNLPGSNDHNSGRLSVGPDSKLYYSIGDMGAGQFDNSARQNNAQDLNIYEGKILRLNLEPISGSWIPTDNPFTDGNGNRTAVYTYGHRNPQGLAWGNVSGSWKLYSCEHGPYSDDEVNLIEGGRNYGWPKVGGYCDGNYNGRYLGGQLVTSEQDACSSLNVREPLATMYSVVTPPDSTTSNLTWPSVAPSGMDVYTNTANPSWSSSLLIAGLKSGTLIRFKLSGDGLTIVSDTIMYFRGKGRFRDVCISPDGKKMTEENWRQDFAKCLAVYLDGQGIHSMDYDGKRIVDDNFYVIFNAHNEPVEYKLPTKRYSSNWIKILDTNNNFVGEEGGEVYRANTRIKVEGFSVVLLKQQTRH